MQKISKAHKTLIVKIENDVLSGNLDSLTQLVLNSNKKNQNNKPLTFQSKTLKIITDIIQKHGFEAIKVSEWANTGKISIQKPNKFGELGNVVYDFQSDSLKFSIKIGDKKVLSQPPRLDYYSFYMNHSDIKSFENFLKSLEQNLKSLL